VRAKTEAQLTLMAVEKQRKFPPPKRQVWLLALAQVWP
jgi:hypothetical protein